VGTFVGMLLHYPYITWGFLLKRCKAADKKSSEDGGCVETTAVIHRTHWVERRCSGSVCFGFGRIGSYVAVRPFFVSSPASTRRLAIFRGGQARLLVCWIFVAAGQFPPPLSSSDPANSVHSGTSPKTLASARPESIAGRWDNRD
jgi:hypothetical protein